MPNYARGSLIDLDHMLGDHLKKDNKAAIRQNIRTKKPMGDAVSNNALPS
jgi:hypothetical protein